MRRFSLLFLAGIIVLTSLISIVSVGECGKKAKKAERKDSKIICWAVTPWPIRHLCNPEDCDRDGVVNPKDKCPGTPKGAIVDEHGCPIDTDGDGVFDGIDKCPDTPFGEIVDADGCSIDQLCPCEKDPPWKNHGKYVSCVAKTAETFVEQGLITKTDKHIIVSGAAISGCGKKK